MCGWQLYGDPVLGEATAEHFAAARAALEAAGHAWDQRAAALTAEYAAGIGIDTASLADALGGVLRGGPLSSLTTAPSRLVDPEELDPPSWRETLAELADGRLPDVLLVVLDADRAGLLRVTMDAFGIPTVSDAGSAAWHDIVPGLSGDPLLLGFQLAGGIGTLPRADGDEFETAVVGWLTSRLPEATGVHPPNRAAAAYTSSGAYASSGAAGARTAHEAYASNAGRGYGDRARPSSAAGQGVVLLRVRPGWPLLERAASSVRVTCSVRAELVVEAGDGAVAGLLRTAPLLRDHTLLMAYADPRTGGVRLEQRVLFPAGVRLPPGESKTVSVTVYGGLTDNSAVALPVLVGRYPEDGDKSLVSVHRTALPALAAVDVTFVLRGPGEVDIEGGHAGTAKGSAGREKPPRRVSDLLTGMVRRIQPPPSLQVVCAVEMSEATEGEAAERLAFVRGLVGALAARQGDGLRVGALGYYDHRPQNRYRHRRILVETAEPGPAADMLGALDTWRAQSQERDGASSLEDALKGAVAMTAPLAYRGERPQYVVLVVGRRPPCCPETFSLVPACPTGVDWREQLKALRARGARVLTRADPQPEPTPGDRAGLRLYQHGVEAWRELGQQGAFLPGVHSADYVAQALAPGWHTEGEASPLAFAEPLARHTAA